ncbi:MAG: PspA-associated protein PspAB [Acidimicrobiales bacterium]
MRFLDTLLGRSRPTPPKLDTLFALPSAAITLEAGAGLRPSGHGAVAYKPASGQAFSTVGDEVAELLALSAGQSGSELRNETDRYGYHWIVVDDPEIEDLVGSVHLVNSTMEDRGFGNQLLCSMFGFDDGKGSRLFLVYLSKRGTFYPFAPQSEERRDNELELRVRGLLGADLPVEADLARWFPLWGVPI